MIYIAVVPNQTISIIHNTNHSFYYLNDTFSLEIFRRYKYLRAKCVIIDNGDLYDIGRWSGIFDVFYWDYKIIESAEWMDYFGVYPDDKKLMVKHWLNVVKYRYPMLPAKTNNYETILAACYIRDKDVNESVGEFA